MPLEVLMMSYRMRLASMPAAMGAYEPLRFELPSSKDGRERPVRTIDPVRGPWLGRRVEYGALFAYLYRRFGRPNAQCPDDRLARYVLTTPLPDMYLVVEPTLAGRSSQVFALLAPVQVQATADAYCESPESCRKRISPPKDWAPDDPLRPYALAATRTLRGLLRPVRLECSGAIDIFGEVPHGGRVLQPAVMAKESAAGGDAHDQEVT